MDEKSWVHYIPVATTLFAIFFLFVLHQHYYNRGRKRHVLWWAIGIFTYGLGTGLEGTITLIGNSVFLTKAWYIAGAILGGYPLAQGTVYLLLKRKTADLLSWITVPTIVVISVLIAMSPVIIENLEAHRPSGDILAWQWVRLTTPFINIYAVIFLIGGAILSSIRYARKKSHPYRVTGNALIAFGALLPGIGGGFAKGGFVEALYVGEFVGLIFIYIGYRFCVQAAPASAGVLPSEEETREPAMAEVS